MTRPIPPDPVPARIVREIPMTGVPAVVHPGWQEEFPWLAQGCTTRGEAGDPFDMGLFVEASPAGVVLARWEALLKRVGLPCGVHARQVHGSAVRFHGSRTPGLHLVDPCDGHATVHAGILMGVSTADCVPVSVVDPRLRAAALLHAGWRGAAAGMVERGIAVLVERLGAAPTDLRVHFGPAICGRCYEVGPEVFRSLGLAEPPGPAPLDLRAELARRAVGAGVEASGVTISGHCTRCGEGFFSHRGGDRERQVGFLGLRA